MPLPRKEDDKSSIAIAALQVLIYREQPTTLLQLEVNTELEIAIGTQHMNIGSGDNLRVEKNTGKVLEKWAWMGSKI
jgi:hypothetical protein